MTRNVVVFTSHQYRIFAAHPSETVSPYFSNYLSNRFYDEVLWLDNVPRHIKMY